MRSRRRTLPVAALAVVLTPRAALACASGHCDIIPMIRVSAVGGALTALGAFSAALLWRRRRRAPVLAALPALALLALQPLRAATATDGSCGQSMAGASLLAALFSLVVAGAYAWWTRPGVARAAVPSA